MALAAVVATTSVVLWLAHVYAHALAESVSEEQPMRARRLVDVGRREATIVLAAVAAAVVLGALDVLKDSTALWLAVWLGVGTLAVQGLRYPGSSSWAAWRRSPSSGRTSRSGS